MPSIKTTAYAAACTLWCIALLATHAQAHAEAPPPLTFAIVSNALGKPADAPPVRQMLDAIGRERDTSFIVYDGNLKGAAEACLDSVYDARRQLLDTSKKPVILLPGEHDWAGCAQAQAGGFDPVERLDFLRQNFFGESESLGQTPMPVTRESDIARFRQFHENVRWQANGVAFIGLNAPGPNNHYLDAGGRNGEFEDRSVANAFWLEHAMEAARRSDMRAVVVILQGDPDFSRYERRDRFSWLRFARGDRTRDGFLELKRNLVQVAEAFRGPVIVIHGSETPLGGGFRIDQPLHNDKGALVPNLTRIAIDLKTPRLQWIEVAADFTRRPPFRVRVKEVPANAAPLPASVTSDTGASSPSSFYQQMVPVQPGTQPGGDLPGSATPASGPSLPPLLDMPPNLPPILPSSPTMPASVPGASQ
jgi:hypothetical protein